MEYRYPHFDRDHLKSAASFGDGPGPGEWFPDVEVSTPEGRPIRTYDLLGTRPALFTLGSFT